MKPYRIPFVLLWLMVSGGEPFATELTFEKDIRPIFRKHCFDCHGAEDEKKGGLDLRLVRFMKRGGESGESIVSGDPEASYLLERLRNREMPPGENKVLPEEFRTIESWIQQGAKTARPEPDSISPGLGITPEERDFWSFHPISRQPVARSEYHLPTERIRSAVDAFIANSMPHNISFAADADRRTLIRRAYLTLLGIPPSPPQINTWLHEPRENWFACLIDELLASPRYGERWARHWLDIAGYADSEGATVVDAERPWAWKYRDWVVKALNDDKPMDQFIVEQIAGDELAGMLDGDLTVRQIELLTATGFLRMSADGTGSGANTPEARNQVIADSIKIVATSLLGLSVQCAQCHDHRYDPIPQTDYYALRAIFEPGMDWNSWRTPQNRRVSLYREADRKNAAKIEEEAQKQDKIRSERQQQYIDAELKKQLERVADDALRAPLKEAYLSSQRTKEQNELLAKHPFVRQLSPGSLYLYNQSAADELKKLATKAAEIRSQKPEEQFLRAFVESPHHVTETKLFYRGDHSQPRQKILPAALTISSAEDNRVLFPENDPNLLTTGRRLAYARWLTSGRHPLVARVLVNRIWLHHFGKGIVGTPSDFGMLGARPTHPKLLDWLADEFVRGEWSLKRLHKTILMSTVWRQTASDVELAKLDPENRYYSRRPLHRLEAEVIRDCMLAVSGNLSTPMFGKPISTQADESGQILVQPHETRRSLYIQVKRSQPVAMFQAFDVPVMETNCECRTHSTVATQALILLNGSLVLQQAKKLCERIDAAVLQKSPEEWADQRRYRVQMAWEFALCRPPTEDEASMADSFLREQIRFFETHNDRLPTGTTAKQQALINLCQSLLSCNEFLYVD